MAMTGWAIDDIQDALKAGFTGTTLTGTGSTPITVGPLHLADDDQNVGVGPRGCSDNGYVLRYIDSREVNIDVPQTAGGRVQRMVDSTWEIDVGSAMEGVSGQTLEDNATSIGRQLWNLVEATLEPQSGALYPVQDLRITGARRNDVATNIYQWTARVTVRHLWERSPA